MSSKDGNSGRNAPRDNLQDRLRSLEERINAHKEEDRARVAPPKSDKSGLGRALRLSSEFISAVLVGAGLGYFLDRFAGTTPWGMIIFLLLGFVAGVVNVLRSSGQMSNPYESGWASRAGGKDSGSQAAGNAAPGKGPADLYDDEDDD